MSTRTDDHSPWQAMLHGFLDGELDSIHATEFEAHLATCRKCSTELARYSAMRKMLGRPDVRWPVPEALRSRVAATIVGSRHPEAINHRATRMLRLIGQWSLPPSLLALAASLFLFFHLPVADSNLQDQIVASHVRSLLADHLADVKTSNRHTVKPWFNGKIDFAPPVVDLVDQGFPLVGGRVDYLGGRVVAALVYRRGGHVINLFIWPNKDLANIGTASEGYNLRQWSTGGLVFWAISDVGEQEINAFRQAFVTAAAESEKQPSPK